MRVLMLVADGFEDVELFYLVYRLREEGAEVVITSPRSTTLTGSHGYRVEPTLPLMEVTAEEYNLLVIPGGRSPEVLRLREEAVDFVRTWMQSDRAICTISHGPQLLISAGSLDGHRLTCSPGIRDDVRAANGLYRDDAVVVSGNLVSCRLRDDIPHLMTPLLESIEQRIG